MTNEDQITPSATTPTLGWRPCPNMPPRVGVRILFAGLMGVFYDVRTGFCEIMFHSSGRHKTGIWALQEPGNQQIPLPPKGHTPETIQQMTIEIPGMASNVCFYQNGADFDRFSGDERDFRWMLDLDGPDFYPANYPKLNVYKSRLTVKQGTVYTFSKNPYRFRRVHVSGTPKPLGNIAKIMGIDIEVPAGRAVNFDIEGQILPLYPGTGISYLLAFSNHCLKPNGSACDELDFHHHLEAINLPPREPRYDLELASTQAETDNEAGLGLAAGSISPRFSDFFDKLGTDLAPCVAVGFGQSNGPPQ